MDITDLQKYLDQAGRGDPVAFETLITAYEKLIYNVAFRMMGNREDAFDMAQEALIKIYKNIEKCVEIRAFKAWACTITTNACLDELRKRKNKKTESLDFIYESEDGSKRRETPSDEPEPQEALLCKEDMKYIAEAINNLSDDYREAVILRDINGLSYQEIAESQNVSIGTVKSRISRARSSLKTILLEQKTYGIRLKE